MRIAVDTNLLVYANGFGDSLRVQASETLLLALAESLVVPTQVIGELFNVLVRKGHFDKAGVLKIIEMVRAAAEVVSPSAETMSRAIHLAVDHGFQIWDAVVVETAIYAGCSMLLSEDMQHGFYWNGLTIINPFVEPMHPLLRDRLDALR